MWRMMVCLGVGLLVASAGMVSAEEKRAADKDAKDGNYMHGKIVRVSPDNNTVTVRVDGKDQEFKVSKTAKFFGEDKKDLSDGLRSKNLKEGTEVWFHTGTGDEKHTITELRCHNPTLKDGK